MTQQTPLMDARQAALSQALEAGQTPPLPATIQAPSAPPASGGSSLPYPSYARVLTLRASPIYEILASWRSHCDPLPEALTFEALRPLSDALAEGLRPATNPEILAQIERLRLHYGEWDALSEQQARLVGLDWLFDFEGYPAVALFEACAAWRNSKARRAPTSGQLKELGDPRVAFWRNVQWKVQQAQAALMRPDRRAR